MGVAELAPTLYDKTNFTTSQSQLSKLVSRPSTRFSNHRRLSYQHLPRPTSTSRIHSSLATNQVQAPVSAAPPSGNLKKKPDCYGVFCLTYDLRAVRFSSSHQVVV